MVKRVVDTKFWTSMDVIDHYSVEDKFFALYIMTNGKSSQLGIYSLPKKIISFETGFTTEVIQVLLTRFSQKYGQILYSEETQEISLLRSLEYSILKGGKPVSDLLQRELSAVKDGRLIVATYQMMKNFWESSKRSFDHTIQSLFEDELLRRQLIVTDSKESEVEGIIHSQGSNREAEANQEEEIHLQRYMNYLNHQKGNLQEELTAENILSLYYQELIGQLTPEINEQLESWTKKLPKSVLLEGIIRSAEKEHPFHYLKKVVANWLGAEVRTLSDVIQLDRQFNRQ